MVGLLSIATGYSPEYLLKEVATGRENYYTGAVAEGEPPGRWWGAGAETLGLTGLVDAQDMRAVYERFLDPREDGFRDPERWDEVYTLGHAGRRYASEQESFEQACAREPNATAERRAQLWTEAGRNARHNVAFFDLTFSVQKSVTLAHTAFEAKEHGARAAGNEDEAQAWGAFREAVEEAIWAGNNAMLAYMADKAGYSRVGHHGGAAGRYVDAHGLVVASFFQHDSRDHDPQLHVHNGTLNRVPDADGTWRTLDSRALHRYRAGGAAVGERVTEERLTAALGMLLATRADGKSREFVDVSAEAMALISSRRHAVTAKTAELIEAYEARHGQAPNARVRDELARQATLATRQAKSHDGESREELLDRVDGRLRAQIGAGLDAIADAALAGRQNRPQAETWSPQAVIELALHEVSQSKSRWTEADLTRAINAALPDHLGITDAAEITTLLDDLTRAALEYAVPIEATRPADQAVPDELRLNNGQSAYQSPGGRLYCTPDQVRSERLLLAGAEGRDGARIAAPQVARFLHELRESGVALGADQQAAVRGLLSSGTRVESLVGPAGTGKSFVVGTLARAWSDPSLTGGPARRVFGLATSEVATTVLAGEGLTARNVEAWLATQRRLDHGSGLPADAGFRLHDGDLVVVDEAAMTDTASLTQIHARVHTAGAKLVLVGDPRQLAAVGAGGAMDLVAARGSHYELTDARRFAHDWEKAASLRLRDGDPSVLDEYHRQGRLVDAGTREQAEQSAATAWVGDTLAGRRSLLLVDSNEQAGRVSAAVRAELVRLGLVTEDGVRLGLQSTFAGVGDLVETRQIAHWLTGHEGNARGPLNRETFRVLEAHPDGSLVVTTDLDSGADSDGRGGLRLVLPAEYVAENVALGYARTVHSAQGVTVDTTHAVVTPGTSAYALYVELSRGAQANTAHVQTLSGPDDPAQGDEDDRMHRSPAATLSTILDDARPDLSAIAEHDESAERMESLPTAVELFADAATMAATARTARQLDELFANGTLTAEQRENIAAEDGTAALARVLRRVEIAGHDPAKALHDAVTDRSLTGARNVANVLHARLATAHDLTPTGQRWADWTPQVDDPAWQTYLDQLAARADTATAALGRQAAEQQPAWAIDALGPVPAADGGADAAGDGGAARAEWERRAGLLAAPRHLAGRGDEPEQPPPGEVERRSARTAVGVLGAPPKPGQVEQYAAFRAASRDLGLPDADQEVLAMSSGGHRARVRAWERDRRCAPRYVANELAGTRQHAEQARHTAALRRAEADAAQTDPNGDPAAAARLREQSDVETDRAERLDGTVAALEQVDRAYNVWSMQSAVSRHNAEVSEAILAEHHADDEPEQQVTAAEWLAARRADEAAEEPHRPITETDLDDHQALDDLTDRDTTDATDDGDGAPEPAGDERDDEQIDADTSADEHRLADGPSDLDDPWAADDRSDDRTPADDDQAPDGDRDGDRGVELETDVEDLRETVEREPAHAGEDMVRSPEAGDVEASLRHAERTLADLRARAAYDAEHQHEDLDDGPAAYAEAPADDRSADDGADAY